MKIELDIDDSTIKAQIENSVRDQLAAKCRGYGSDSHIKARIDALWPSAVDRIINQMLAESAPLKTKIAAEIEHKLRRKIAAVMNAGSASLIP